jgi:hypothetical protein
MCSYSGYYRIQNAMFQAVQQSSRWFCNVGTFLASRFVYITHNLTKEQAVLVVMGRKRGLETTQRKIWFEVNWKALNAFWVF